MCSPRCQTARKPSGPGWPNSTCGSQAERRVLPLAAPLSEREVAVLRLLRGTLSRREIGQELHVSANTIKTHTQAIYRKLGVSTRHDAVRQGEQAGIL